MKTITFLFPCKGTNMSGGLRVVCEYANRLAREGYDVHIAYAGSVFWSEKTLRYKLSGIVRYIQTWLMGYSCRRWFSLDRRVKEHWTWSLNERHVPKSDIYVCTSPYTAMYLNDYKISEERKFYFIQDYENWGGLSEEKLRATYRYKMRKIVISHWLKDIIEEEGEECALVPNGIDTSRFAMKRPISEKDKYRITMLYHSARHKASEIGIDALELVHQRYPQIRVNIFGLPKRPSDLPEWFDYHQNPTSEKLNELYDEAAIFIGTSRKEGWGLTIGEAMLCGQAVACTDTTGYLEMAIDNETALLSPIDDAKALADNVIRLMEDDELRIRIAERGNAEIKRFTWEKAFEKMKKELTSKSYDILAERYVAKAYAPYIMKIDKWVREHGVEDIYFLSRDGYVLMKGYEELAEKEGSAAPHYLFVSRRSLLLPYLHWAIKNGESVEDAYLSVMDHNSLKGANVESLLKALGTSDDEQSENGIRFGYRKIRTLGQERDFLDKMFSTDNMKKIEGRARDAYEMLMKYLEQEGVLSGKRIAMVDVGWLGTSRRMMQKLVGVSQAEKSEYYYYGVRRDVLPQTDGQFYTYFEAGELSTLATALIEDYFSASPYPTTIGYRNEGEIIKPVFPDGETWREDLTTQSNEMRLKEATAKLAMQKYDESALYQQARSSIDEILTMNADIDLTPLVAVGQKNGNSFVRKLTAKELMRMTLMGENITTFDRGSLYFTSRNAYQMLWPIHEMTGWLRRKIYLMTTR